MTVSQLLRSLPAREIAEWQAYERAYGPLGRSHVEEKLAEIHETLHLLISVNVKDYEIPRSTRPSEVWDKQQEVD